jgi:hypothetical protein
VLPTSADTNDDAEEVEFEAMLTATANGRNPAPAVVVVLLLLSPPLVATMREINSYFDCCCSANGSYDDDGAIVYIQRILSQTALSSG